MLVLEWMLHLLYPPKCVLCQKLLQDNETDLCTQCRSGLRYYEAPIRKPEMVSSVIGACHYEDNVRESILRFKFDGKSCYAGAFGRMLGMRILKQAPEYDLITWIPVSAKRKRERGYDQSRLLAQAAAKELGSETVPTLKKIRDIPPQSGIEDAAARKANVIGVYRAVNPGQFRQKRILLIDDIITTGATASEAARTLLTAGAENVTVAVLAVARK